MGKIFVVGLGPGDRLHMTEEALAALDGADVLCGYTKYAELVGELYPDKKTCTSGMRQELDRCRAALSLAQEGRTVALICSGDAGVYGMASPLLEMSGDYPDVDIEIVSGVTAALSGAAILGAPLGHDFCVISLSDLLTPWDLIERRLRAAAQADFIICIYNPSSQRRCDYLKKACGILLNEGKDPHTVCGIVRNIGRQGQESKILSLSELCSQTVDMFTTVFIGSRTTKAVSGRMVTPRGYREA
ncbi:MAG: precorrin-3B C(17)-methyltransferase [Clostridia bacterium]|nr:precorrin-3B C(17)-methyltransferase [Clostridia bacterium]